MISKKTLRKAVSQLQKKLDRFMNKDYANLRIHISKGNVKIGNVWNFSTAPVITCGNCSECMSWCYDIKAVIQYENVRNARAENTALMRLDMDKTFRQIQEFISKRRAHFYFRWHVAGEIMNYHYLEKMIETAKMFPHWHFWTYTKMYELVNIWCDIHGKENMPKNLKIMFSEWPGMPMDNRHGFPVFRVIMVSKGEKFTEGVYRCNGDCGSCIRINRGCVAGEDVEAGDH